MVQVTTTEIPRPVQGPLQNPCTSVYSSLRIGATQLDPHPMGFSGSTCHTVDLSGRSK